MADKEPTVWQARFAIDGLVPSELNLKSSFWLKRGKVLLEKNGGSLFAHVLHEGTNVHGAEDTLLPYLKIVPLVSNNCPEANFGSAIGLQDRTQFCKDLQQYLSAEISVSLGVSDNTRESIEADVPKFLRDVRTLHNKCADVVTDNGFLSLALDFFYDARSKSVFSDEGFTSAVICLEALFNDGASDIKYKISMRVAFLLGLVGDNAVEIFEDFREIYKYRNSLVHGQRRYERKPGDRTYRIERYARRSLWICLILLRKKVRRDIKAAQRKTELVREIDHAILNSKKTDSLRKEIENGMKLFDLSVPRTYIGKSKSGRETRSTIW